MCKYFTSSIRYFAFFIAVAFFNGCSSDSAIDAQEAKQYQEIYQSLKDKQSKVIVKLDGKDFYNAESIFTGHLEMFPGSFTMSYFDQFQSNVMLHFGGKEWYKARPIKTLIKLDNGYSSNVMIGKIIDKEKQVGAGYLMNEGTMTFKVFTKEKFIIVIEGKAKKYPRVEENAPSFEVKATIICKNPSLDVMGIDGKESFYGN